MVTTKQTEAVELTAWSEITRRPVDSGSRFMWRATAVVKLDDGRSVVKHVYDSTRKGVQRVIDKRPVGTMLSGMTYCEDGRTPTWQLDIFMGVWV